MWYYLNKDTNHTDIKENNMKKIAIAVTAVLCITMIGCVNTRTKIECQAEKQAVSVPLGSSDTDYLVLVNRQRRIPENWESRTSLIRTKNSLGDEIAIESRTYEAYLGLKNALENEDVFIDIESSFRSTEEQQFIVDKFIRKYGRDYAERYAALPGYSEHHTGLALDLYLYIDGQSVYYTDAHADKWEQIHSKLAEHGFILRYQHGKEDITGYSYEPWHIRYVGKDAAREMTSRSITLEEYLGETDHSGTLAN